MRAPRRTESRARAAGGPRSQLQCAAEAGGDAAAERQTEPAAGVVAIDRSETDAVVVDEQTPRARRARRGHLNVPGAGSDGVREQVAQDHTERGRRQRQRRGHVGRDLDLDVEILDGLLEALRHRGERLVARFAPRRLEQRVDEKDRVLDGPGRVVGDERGLRAGSSARARRAPRNPRAPRCAGQAGSSFAPGALRPHAA